MAESVLDSLHIDVDRDYPVSPQLWDRTLESVLAAISGSTS